MSFLNTALLAGLGAVLIPVIIHLLSRRTAKIVEWGAMQFLMDSVESRKSRIELEEALLMAARALLMGLVALAVARPFVPPGSAVPWGVVLPAFLLGVVALTTAVVLRARRRWFWGLLLAGLALLALCVLAVMYEKEWNLKRFGTAGRKDVAIVIDGSTSMQLASGVAGTNFDLALLEAREIIEKASGGTAFSLILGGPVPMPRVPEPVVNRTDLLQALGAMKPVRGRMAAFDALAAAAVSVAAGSNPNKEIIVLTDGQNMGWELDNRARWESLLSGMETLKSKPRIMMRKYTLPTAFRNVAAAGISYSREVIGTDRPVTIEVTVENTGTEALTPGGVELHIGETVLKDPGTGQLPPGGKETVRFLHQFKEAGSVPVRAVVLGRDDLPLDDETVSVCSVIDRLPVLLIDGNPSERFLDRAGAFTALALAPAVLAGTKEANKESVAMAPEVMPVSRALNVTSFAPWRVIILAGIPKLPESVTRRLTGWVQGGGGLLVLPGANADPAFYNQWRAPDGGRLLPARLISENLPPDGVTLALNTFSHPALRLVADSKQSDLGTALLQRYWKMEPDAASGASAGGRASNGDAFLASAKSGFGTVVMTSCNFDTASGNLPSRQAFVALVHQLVYHLANPDGQPLNREPAAQLNLPLARGSAEGGLKGEYFRGVATGQPVHVRIDARPDFQWGGGSPAPGVSEDFTARWTGALLPRYSEEYVFDGWGDDSVTVTIGGRKVIERGGEGRMTLEAGRYYPIQIDLVDGSGGAAMQIFWRSQSQSREILPADCLTPFPPGSEQAETVVGSLDVAGPDELPRAADLVFTRGGLVARLGSDIVPGLYRMKIPAERIKDYGSLPGKDGTIPFSVADDAAESRMTPLGPKDLDFVRNRIELLEPPGAQEIVTVLSGREFGEELWKYLAVGALFLLLCETALTRWIAVGRRSGDDVSVDFENKFEPSRQFRDALERVRQGTNP